MKILPTLLILLAPLLLFGQEKDSTIFRFQTFMPDRLLDALENCADYDIALAGKVKTVTITTCCSTHSYLVVDGIVIGNRNTVRYGNKNFGTEIHHLRYHFAQDGQIDSIVGESQECHFYRKKSINLEVNYVEKVIFHNGRLQSISYGPKGAIGELHTLTYDSLNRPIEHKYYNYHLETFQFFHYNEQGQLSDFQRYYYGSRGPRKIIPSSLHKFLVFAGTYDYSQPGYVKRTLISKTDTLYDSIPISVFESQEQDLNDSPNLKWGTRGGVGWRVHQRYVMGDYPGNTIYYRAIEERVETAADAHGNWTDGHSSGTKSLPAGFSRYEPVKFLKAKGEKHRVWIWRGTRQIEYWE